MVTATDHRWKLAVTCSPLGMDMMQETTRPLFNFYLSQNTYNPGDNITVFMNSSINPDNPENEWFMEGILIQARTLDCSLVTSVGTFSVPPCDDFLQTIDCFGLKNSAIRHYTHIHVFNKTFTWTAPSQSIGHVYFRATVARNLEKFWTNVFSEVIMDPTDSNTNLEPCPVMSLRGDLTSASNFVKLDIISMAVFGLIAYFF